MIDQIPQYPNERHVEGAVLAAALSDRECSAKMSSVDEDMFTGEDHLEIYRAIRKLVDDGAPVDDIVVGDLLKGLSQSSFRRVGELQPTILTTHDMDYYIGMLRKYRAIRDVVEISHTLSADRDSPVEAMIRCEAMISASLSRATVAPAEKIDLVERLERYQDGIIQPMPLGAVELSQYEIYRPSLVILAARPSVGKSSFALHILDACAGAGWKAAYYSIEMPIEEVMLRRVSARSGVPVSRMRARGGLTPDDWRLIGSAADKVEKSGAKVVCGPQSMASLLGSVRQDCKDGMAVIIIDYIGLISNMDAGGTGANLSQSIGDLCSRLADLTRSNNVIIIAVAQLNRGVEHRDNKKPMLSDLRDSGGIEQAADVVMMLYRECYYDPRGDPNVASVLVRKNRSGVVGESVIPVALYCGAWGDVAKERKGCSL